METYYIPACSVLPLSKNHEWRKHVIQSTWIFSHNTHSLEKLKLHITCITFFDIDRINFPQKQERKRTSKNWRKYGVHALLHRNLWILTQNVTKKVEILVFKLIEYILKEKCKYVWLFLSYIVYTLCIKVTGKWTT